MAAPLSQGVPATRHLLDEGALIGTVKAPILEGWGRGASRHHRSSRVVSITSAYIGDGPTPAAFTRILELAPERRGLRKSAPQGVKNKAFYGENISVNGIKTGDTLNIVKRTPDLWHRPQWSTIA